MRIAISGTANTGKSTLIQHFLSTWSQYKTPSKSYRDILKENKLKHSTKSTVKTQFSILDFMVNQLKTYTKDDKVIYDRCPLDNLVYSLWCNEKGVEGFDSDFIEMTALKPDILMLQQYISSKSNLDNILFLGIFNKLNNEHIGNLKFEPINVNEGYAIMGILIGEKLWRGKGVAAEVLTESFKWLKKNKGIKCIVLGVNKKNYAAIRAYAKVGFQIQPAKHIKKLSNDNITMIKQLI